MFKKWKKIVDEYWRYFDAFMKIDIARHDATNAFAYHMTACKELLEAKEPKYKEMGELNKAISKAIVMTNILLKSDIELDGFILITRCGGMITEGHLPHMNTEEQKKIFIKMIEIAKGQLEGKIKTLEI